MKGKYPILAKDKYSGILISYKVYFKLKNILKIKKDISDDRVSSMWVCQPYMDVQLIKVLQYKGSKTQRTWEGKTSTPF